MTRLLEYQVPGEWDGAAVKEYLRRGLGFSARVLTQQKFLEGGLLRNGAPCRAVDRLAAGDRLALAFRDEPVDYPPAAGELAVVYEDGDYLIVNKPPAMPVHPSPGHDTDSLLNRVAYYYEKTGQAHRVRPLYRLDKDTTGLVVLAKHRAAASCSRAEKRYYAVCQGELAGSGTIDAPIGLGEGSKIVREYGRGQPAVTHWRALARGGGHTLLSLGLETGRTHQIRCHLAGVGHPLAGDDLYGGSLALLPRQALHCGRVLLCCPALAMEREFQADLPQDLRRAFPWLPDWEDITKEEKLCPPA